MLTNHQRGPMPCNKGRVWDVGYSQSKIGLYLLNNCNGSFLIIFTMRNFNFRIGTYSGDTLWSLSWIKSSQLDLYNTDSGIDATGDWALSLTAVSQQGEDAKAKSRSMNLQAHWFHTYLPYLPSDINKSNVSKNIKDFKSTWNGNCLLAVFWYNPHRQGRILYWKLRC